jgi:hypothetical protein
MKKLTRRDFLKFLGVGAFGFITRSKMNYRDLAALDRASNVVQCFDENALTGSVINESIVQIMVDASIRALTGITSVGEAWKSIFPGIDENKVIGIKVNCLFPITTHRPFVNCLVNSLSQIDFGGSFFKKNNIIIWDNQDNLLTGNGGYTIYDGSDPDTVRCFGTNHSGVGYDPLVLNVNGVSSNPSRILTTVCDYIINAAVIKDHSIGVVTLTLKNNYGSINNPGSLHGGQCNPYIPSLNQQIRDVIDPPDIQKLFVIDSLMGCYSGGPDGAVNMWPEKIIMSLDPVACDCQGQNLINQERASHALPLLDAPHITTAAQPPYNLGTTEINLIEINNPSGIEESRPGIFDNHLKVFPEPIRSRATIVFTNPRAGVIYCDLVDRAGRLVANIYSGPQDRGVRQIDFKVSNRCAAGTYFIRIYNGLTYQSRKVTVIK